MAAAQFIKIPANQSSIFKITQRFQKIEPIETAGGFFIVNVSVLNLGLTDTAITKIITSFPKITKDDFAAKLTVITSKLSSPAASISEDATPI